MPKELIVTIADPDPSDPPPAGDYKSIEELAVMFRGRLENNQYPVISMTFDGQELEA